MYSGGANAFERIDLETGQDRLREKCVPLSAVMTFAPLMG